MKKELESIFNKLDQWIVETKEQATNQGFRFNPACEFTILGQMGLLVDEEVVAKLNPIATMDLDAWVKTETMISSKFKELLKEANLVLDELSNEIWLPKETKYVDFFEGEYVKCKRALPLYLLVSKAVKAPGKNKILIQNALIEYGDELIKLIKKYDGDLDYFM